MKLVVENVTKTVWCREMVKAYSCELLNSIDDTPKEDYPKTISQVMVATELRVASNTCILLEDVPEDSIICVKTTNRRSIFYRSNGRQTFIAHWETSIDRDPLPVKDVLKNLVTRKAIVQIAHDMDEAMDWFSSPE